MQKQDTGKKIMRLGIIALMVALAIAYMRTNKAVADTSKGLLGNIFATSTGHSGASGAVAAYPQDRVLTDEEVFQLASTMTRMVGLNADQFIVLATAYIESNFTPWAERYEAHINDYSVGIMQVLVGTASDLYAKGYTAMGKPSRAALKRPEVSMYFGAAYMDWLRRSYPARSLEWYVRAYNGGAGHNYSTATGVYWQKFKTAYAMWSDTAGVTIRTGG